MIRKSAIYFFLLLTISCQISYSFSKEEIPLKRHRLISQKQVKDYKLIKKLDAQLRDTNGPEYTYAEIQNKETLSHAIVLKKVWESALKSGKSISKRSFVISPKYKSFDFTIGRGAIAELDTDYGKKKSFHIFNLSLKKIHPNDFDKAHVFKMGEKPYNTVRVVANGKSAALSFDGKEIIPFKHEKLGYVSRFFMAEDADSKTMYDQSGNQLYPSFPKDKFTVIPQQNEVMLITRKDKSKQPNAVYINLNTKDTIASGLFGRPFMGGYAILRRPTGITVIDSTGTFQMPPDPEVGSISFLTAHKYLLLSKTDRSASKEEIKKKRFYQFSFFDMANQKEHVIDLGHHNKTIHKIDVEDTRFKKGVIRAKFTYRMPIYDSEKGDVSVFALIDKSGKVLGLDNLFLSMSQFSGSNLSIVRIPSVNKVENPKFGLIDRSGELITSKPYREIIVYKNVHFAKENDFYYMMNPTTGETTGFRFKNKTEIETLIDKALNDSENKGKRP